MMAGGLVKSLEMAVTRGKNIKYQTSEDEYA